MKICVCRVYFRIFAEFYASRYPIVDEWLPLCNLSGIAFGKEAETIKIKLWDTHQLIITAKPFRFDTFKKKDCCETSSWLKEYKSDSFFIACKVILSFRLDCWKLEIWMTQCGLK